MINLVTGASGFIGSHLVNRLVKNGEQVISLVHDFKLHTNKWLETSLTQTIRVRGDIRDLDFLMRIINQYEVNRVYHLAAQSIVKHAWKDPVNTFDINIMGTCKLLQVCRLLEVNKIIVQSTDKVYGNHKLASSKDKLVATEPYATSKICTDLIAQTFNKTYGMNITIIRSCNTYGLDWNNRIIPNTIRSCLRQESPIIYSNDHSLRQYIFVDDVTRVLSNLQSSNKTILNLANPSDIFSQENVVRQILEFFPNLQPKYVKKPVLNQIQYQSITTDFNINYTPFKEGIKQTISRFKEYLLR